MSVQTHIPLLPVKTWSRHKHLRPPAPLLSLPLPSFPQKQQFGFSLQPIRNPIGPQPCLCVTYRRAHWLSGASISGVHVYTFTPPARAGARPSLLRGSAISHPPNCDENSGTYTAGSLSTSKTTNCCLHDFLLRKKKSAYTSSSILSILLNWSF